ncbi:hypothetical protein ACIB24_00390 [Spongisporangium articulatum]|uniref:PBP domain-containing protein n=1 Tax=Spongisporangium articulatum TaxID=3362603 RepID=A0ABW8AH75_9ACTN
MTRKKTLALVAAATGLLAVLATQNSALADTNEGSDSTLVMVGSDTSQDVMEGLSQVVVNGAGNPLLSNYKATPVGRTVTTRTANAANCTFTVARSSGEGVNALAASIAGTAFNGGGATTPVTSPNMTGCVDVARSSSATISPSPNPGAGNLTLIPFATDSVSFATTNVSGIQHRLTLAALKAYYTSNGTPGSAGSAGCRGAKPLLPASGSGTRNFFRTMLGITSDTIGATGGWGTCVRDTNAAGTPIQEHDGRFLTDSQQLVPFSVSQYIAQQSSQISDIRGRATLGSIDWTDTALAAKATSPVLLQTSFGQGTRQLYNVVQTSRLGDAKVSEAFVGGGSDVCQATATIQAYGLATYAQCGSTTLTN